MFFIPGPGCRARAESSRGAGSSSSRVGLGFWFRGKGEKLTVDPENPVPQRESAWADPPLRRQNSPSGRKKTKSRPPSFVSIKTKAKRRKNKADGGAERRERTDPAYRKAFRTK